MHIVTRLQADELVRAEQLAEDFGVSAETIRRDLLVLEQRGVARRVYGGAMSATHRAVEAPYEERRIEHLECKRAIARLAVGLVSPGETLSFDVGTSVAEVARALPQEWTGLVLTSSLPTATELAGRPGVSVLTSGGRVRAGDLALYGSHTEDFYRAYYADTAFLGSGGVHPEAGLTDYYPDEVATRRIMLAHASRTYVLAHCAKLGRIAVGKVCPLTQVTGVITDDHADPAIVAALAAAGVRVLVAAVSQEGKDGDGKNRKGESP